MNGRKIKFAALALTTCVFQFQFLGCSREFIAATIQGFTQTFGRAIGTTVGTDVGGLVNLGNLLAGG